VSAIVSFEGKGQASQPQLERPTILGSIVQAVERLAACPGLREARNRHHVASAPVQGVLDPQIAEQEEAWASKGEQRDPATHFPHDPRKRYLGGLHHRYGREAA
jgi:hypothetical protein